MGSHNNIDLASSNLFNRFILLFFGTETAQHRHIHRKVFKTLSHRVIMLLSPLKRLVMGEYGGAWQEQMVRTFRDNLS